MNYVEFWSSWRESYYFQGAVSEWSCSEDQDCEEVLDKTAERFSGWRNNSIVPLAVQNTI